jgi:hypothetical protein
VPSNPPLGPTVHYENKAHEKDGSALDPWRPEGLVYAPTPNGPLLLGAVFKMDRAGQAGPTPAGPIAHWHSHPNLCVSLLNLGLSGIATPGGTCPPGALNVTTPAMLHVWTVDNPGGPWVDELDKAYLARLLRG